MKANWIRCENRMGIQKISDVVETDGTVSIREAVEWVEMMGKFQERES